MAHTLVKLGLKFNLAVMFFLKNLSPLVEEAWFRDSSCCLNEMFIFLVKKKLSTREVKNKESLGVALRPTKVVPKKDKPRESKNKQKTRRVKILLWQHGKR